MAANMQWLSRISKFTVQMSRVLRRMSLYAKNQKSLKLKKTEKNRPPIGCSYEKEDRII